ncbi:MAG: two-component sensor histidine kinase [Firmicutes bacterium HGW-Firmicutes-5]|nr:MAG: two-component sensor histidine kinase [Firmicutes bacterium HGW-Firmicutes-5]
MVSNQKRDTEQPVKKKLETPITNQIFIKTFIRTNGNNTNTTEEQRRRLKNYLLILRLFPFIFLLVVTGFFYLLFFLSSYNFPRLILSGIFMVIFIREVSTLIFSFRMRNNILRPLEHLQQAVDEVTGGNYGYTVDETVPTMISGLFHSFNKMSVQLKEGQAVKEKYEQNRKELIAGISHDLKTPITSILGYVEGINEGVANTEEKMQTYMDIIYKNAQYTNQLIDDLFLFSKLDINQMEYHFEPISVKDYFLDIFVEKKIDLEEQGAKVVYAIDLEEDFVMAIDSKLVHRIVSNVIGNAVKYNDKPNLNLHLHVKALESTVHGIIVSVSDNGIGIDEAHIHQIFDVFYRGDDSRSKDVGGTGLGLSISRQLVEAHGGTIWAESTPGTGTTIHFTLLDQLKEVNHGEDINY